MSTCPVELIMSVAILLNLVKYCVQNKSDIHKLTGKVVSPH